MKFASFRLYELWWLSYLLHVILLFSRYPVATAFTSSFTTQYTAKSRTTPKLVSLAGDVIRIDMMTDKNDSGDVGELTKKPRVNFSSTLSSSIPTNASPIDVVLSWLASDIGSIILGGVGLLVLLIGRGILDNDTINISPEAMAEQTRVNLLAVFAVGAVLLNGLSQLDVQSALAEKVDLLGKVISKPILLKNNDSFEIMNEQISWVLSSILAATPACTVILLVRSPTEDDNDEERWIPIAYVGVLNPNVLMDPPKLSKDTPIMDRMARVTTTTTTNDFVAERRESYLPTLQALPGRVEFTNFLLPSNTQAALLLPIRLAASNTATLLLGSNQARSFTPRDIAWSQSVATRLELPLQ